MVKVGLIGLGHLGSIHLEQLLKVADIQVVGVFDADASRARERGSHAGVPVFDSAEALIEASDAIDIVSPTPTHFGYGMACIRRGRHVFIEKPLASTAGEADQLASAAETAGVVAQVGHVERFNPAFVAALPHFRNPLFIEAHRLAQFTVRGTDVSVIFDLMIHDLDIILSLNPGPVAGIEASGVAVISDTPDIANARIAFENGCVANLTASRISVKKMRKARFFQPNAYLSVDFLKKKTEVIRIGELPKEPDPLAMVLDLGDKGKKVISFDHPDVADTNAIRTELEHFARAVVDGGQPAVPARDGARAVRIAHEISEKIKQVPMLSGSLPA